MPPRLAAGIELIDQENRDGIHINVRISHVPKLYGDNIKDIDVVRKAKELDAILVSEDANFKTIKANKQLIKHLGVGYVLYKPPLHGTRFWEKSLAFILAWEDLKEEVRNSEPPFLSGLIKKERFFTNHFK